MGSKMPSCRLHIFADATPQMGTGHIMRCLALAQAAQDCGLEVQMLSRISVEWVAERLAQVGIPLRRFPGLPPAAEDIAALLERLCDAQARVGDWVVTDGYHFTPACQRAIMAAGYRLLVIDDYNHLPEYHCDILLNQNIGAEKLHYRGNIGRQLLGIDYVLLRREFIHAKAAAATRAWLSQPRNILVSMGGGNFITDLERLAPMFSLRELAGRTLRVIKGAMDADRIHAVLADTPASVELLERVDDMAGLLLQTDLCVTAGGSTCWELCCMGVPFLTLKLAENQREIVNGLAELGIAEHYSLDRFRTLLTSPAAYRECTNARGATVASAGGPYTISLMCNTE